jgi:arsenate reductase
MAQPIRILVLCTGNSCRSQMAEGFFRKIGSGRIEAYSAGLTPKRVHPKAIAVMREVGIDISGHTSHHLSEYITQQFDFVITVCDNAAENCPVFPGATTKLHWPYDDPDKATGTEEQVIGEFRRVRDAIRLRIAAWVATTVKA